MCMNILAATKGNRAMAARPAAYDECDFRSRTRPEISESFLSLQPVSNELHNKPTGGQSKAKSPQPSDLTHEHPKEVLVGEGKDKYLCVSCNFILRYPVQNKCGHRFCRQCVTNLPEDKDSFCPACRREGEGDQTLSAADITPDPGAKRDLFKQRARCVHEDCQWTGKFAEYLLHHASCEFKPKKCVCGMMIPTKKINDHMAKDCTFRLIHCVYCGLQEKAIDMHQHLNACEMYPVDCPNQCGKKVPRNEVGKHTDPMKGTCEKQPCPFPGCQENIKGGHMKSFAGVHLEKLWGEVQTMTSKLRHPGQGARELDAGKTDNTIGLPDRVQASEKLLDEIKSKFEKMMDGSKNAAGDVKPSTQTNHVMAQAAGGRHTPNQNGSSSEINTIVARQENIEGSVKRFHEELVTVKNHRDTINEQILSETNPMKRLVERVSHLERSVAQSDLALSGIETRLQDMEACSYDGTLVWSIKEFARKREEAISGRVRSIFSKPFYTSKSGYKMSARIYLNGDGMGKNTHISLFFVLMRGRCDAILPWPFRQKVTMSLIDQVKQSDHTDAFRPDSSSSSFQRPTTDMNLASGVPLFYSLDKLNDKKSHYLKDDEIFVKVVVDLSGI